jgi:hypothetical protein
MRGATKWSVVAREPMPVTMHTTHSSCRIQRAKICRTRISILSARHYHYYWGRFISKKNRLVFQRRRSNLESVFSVWGIMVHQLCLENSQAFVPKGISWAGEHFSLFPPQEDSCFQQAVGGDGYCHERNHSSPVFCKIEPLNNMVISQTCSDMGLNHAHFLYDAEVRCRNEEPSVGRLWHYVVRSKSFCLKSRPSRFPHTKCILQLNHISQIFAEINKLDISIASTWSGRVKRILKFSKESWNCGRGKWKKRKSFLYRH